MNITNQIINDAESRYGFDIAILKDKTSYLSTKDKISFFKKEYRRISKILNEEYKEQIKTFPLRDLLAFDVYEKLIGFTRHFLQPLSTHTEIAFQDTQQEDFKIGPNRQPIVRKNYNFARHHEIGQKLSDYLQLILILKWLRNQTGYDTNRYPDRSYLVAFKNGDTVYVRYDDFPEGVKLYYDETGNQAILDACDEIIHCQKPRVALDPLLQKLPYYSGDEALTVFDREWYKHEKQSPLNYRCFPSISGFKMTPNPNPGACMWSGEYCISKKELDNRYTRFINLYNHLDKNEQQELLLNSIDYFNKFLQTDCFEKTIHKKPFEEILSKLKALKTDSVISTETDLSYLSEAPTNDATQRSIPGKNPSTISFLNGTQEEKEELLNFIVDTYSGKKGKRIAIMIQALEENNRIAYHERTELYAALRKDFVDIGANSGINKYMTDNMREDKTIRKDVELHAEKIRKHLENLPK
ncbi:hypothetical protein [Sunxiuqinia sp. sy24]|uniref:hypothetical protein n=1 Tax=Sunxiuqinia sp. sy24 TaxID=3461495 RepID=UPI0040454C68